MQRQEGLLDIENALRKLKQEIDDLVARIENKHHKAIITDLYDKLDRLSVVKIDHDELSSLIAANDMHATYEAILDNHKHQLLDDEQLAAKFMVRLASTHERIAPSVEKLASSNVAPGNISDSYLLMFTSIIQDASTKCALAGAVSLLLKGNSHVDDLIAGYFSDANHALVSKGFPVLSVCYQGSLLKQELQKQKRLCRELTGVLTQLEGDIKLLESIVSDSMGITINEKPTSVTSAGVASVGLFADQATLPNSSNENDKSYSKSKMPSP